MGEKSTIFNSKIKYKGIFNFKDFYSFCYDWLIDETGLDSLAEEEYSEKIEGNSKNIDISWSGQKKISEYFRFDYQISFRIIKLEKVEINKGGIKIGTNKGNIQVSIKGILVRDYQGKFEKNATMMFLRDAYERWIITSAIDQWEGKLFSDCDEFLAQAKAYLDLEGRR